MHTNMMTQEASKEPWEAYGNSCNVAVHDLISQEHWLQNNAMPWYAMISNRTSQHS